MSQTPPRERVRPPYLDLIDHALGLPIAAAVLYLLADDVLLNPMIAINAHGPNGATRLKDER